MTTLVVDCPLENCEAVLEDMDDLADHISDDHDVLDRIFDAAEFRRATPGGERA